MWPTRLQPLFPCSIRLAALCCLFGFLFLCTGTLFFWPTLCGMHKRLEYFLIEDMPLMHGHPTSRSHLEWMHRPTPTIMHVLALHEHFYAALPICVHVPRTGDAPYSRGQGVINSEGQVRQHQDHSPVDFFCGSCMARMLTNGSWVGCPIASQGDTNTNTDTTYGPKI